MSTDPKGRIVTLICRIEDPAAFSALRLYAENPPGLFLVGMSAANLWRVRDEFRAELIRLREEVSTDEIPRIDAVLAREYLQEGTKP